MPEFRSDPQVAALLALTFVSGVLDAVSFLGLGHVFTANMTGNLLILGFSAAGAPGFSVGRSLTALTGFVLGTAVGGRLAAGMADGPRHRWVGTALAAEAVLVSVAAAVAATAAGRTAEHAVVAVLALAMGIRNATVRRLAVPDMTTTVVTRTLTGLVADSSLAGGSNPRALRRAGGILALVAGAAAGAWVLPHHGAAAGLLLAAVLAAAVATSHTAWAHRAAR
ncbi:YoaK family protein [Streptomyces sp. NPDC001380]|uniref:YoaK family protein n=1 Tax=Streptomyces sp. NPDC001380 TaxID=3364566 RepID=UPI0036B3FDF0